MGNYNSSPDWSNYSGGYGAGSGGSGTGGSGSGSSGTGGSGTSSSGTGGSGSGNSGTSGSGTGGSGTGGSGTGGSGTGGSGTGGSGTGGSGTGGSGTGGSGTGGSGSGGSGIGSSGSGDPVISSCGVDKGGYAVAAKGAKPVKIDGTSGEICSETKKIKTFSKKLSDALELIKNTSEGARIISELENNPEIIKVFIKEGGTGLGLTKVVDLTPDRSMLDLLLGNEPDHIYAIEISINMNVGDPSFISEDGSLFIPTLERVLGHELGHASIFSSGSFVELSVNQKDAVRIENKIATELDPSSPIRHLTKGHGSGVF